MGDPGVSAVVSIGNKRTALSHDYERLSIINVFGMLQMICVRLQVNGDWAIFCLLFGLIGIL